MTSTALANQRALPALSPVKAVRLHALPPRQEPSPFARQLAVLPEMLSSLDTLTTAGQHHVMSKVVTFIHDQAGRTCQRLSARNRGMFLDLLGRLRSESDRRLPDIRSFRDRAECLGALLAGIV